MLKKELAKSKFKLSTPLEQSYSCHSDNLIRTCLLDFFSKTKYKKQQCIYINIRRWIHLKSININDLNPRGKVRIPLNSPRVLKIFNTLLKLSKDAICVIRGEVSMLMFLFPFILSRMFVVIDRYLSLIRYLCLLSCSS